LKLYAIVYNLPILSILGNANTLIDVKDVVDVTFPSDDQIISRSPVNTMLAAKWSIKTTQGMTPKWY
jgi:hypothetical protein